MQARWEADEALIVSPSESGRNEHTQTFSPYSLADDDGKAMREQTDVLLATAAPAEHSFSARNPDEMPNGQVHIWEIHHESVDEMPASLRRRAKAGDPTVVIR